MNNGQTAFNPQHQHQAAPSRVLENVDMSGPTRASIEQILAATEQRRTDSVMEQARIGFRSKYLPKHITNEEQAIAIALAGAELGISPMTAFRQIYFFDGRIVLSASLLVALAHKKVEGFRLDILKATEAGCWVRAWRPNMTEPAPFYFTIEDATRAGLTSKDNWKKYPAAMCIARASAMAVRAIAPEAALGMLTQEEKDDGIRFEVDVTPEGLQVAPQASPVSPVDALKNQLRQQQPTPAAPADKKAARLAPPPGFATDDPSSPPAGFPSSKRKGKDQPAPTTTTSPAATPKEESKPADPFDCTHRKEGDVFEARGDKYIVRKSGVGLVPELLHDGPATQDAPPEVDEPGSDG